MAPKRTMAGGMDVSAGEQPLRALAAKAGIVDEYIDQTGRETRRTSDDTRATLLAAMRFDASTEAEARRSLEQWITEEEERVLDPVAVHRMSGEPLLVDARLTGTERPRARWRAELVDESGEARMLEGESLARDARVRVPLPPGLAPGYYTVRLWLEGRDGPVRGEQSLIVAPLRAPSVSELTGRERVCGLFANLYSVRGARDWGLGDMGTLAELVEWAGDLGAAFVGVNPLHALRNRGMDVSPYSPVSRLFRNFVYIDPEGIPELHRSPEARALLASPAMQGAVAQLREGGRVDYEQVAHHKRQLLELLFRAFENASGNGDGGRMAAYRTFLEARGERLRAFATWQALDDHFGNPDGGWHAWPEPYRAAASRPVTEFAESHRREVEFHQWVQFELERQLGDVARIARERGVTLGVYQDLAIGTAGWGSDLWASAGLFATGVNIGAPPDSYSAVGQDWGLPPMDPHRLRETGYAYWIALLRSAFAHAGALRIDHVLGLFRQFWIPHGRTGREGAYVRFPSDDMLGILALEAVRHRALVVGEDLGTVPPEVGPALERWGVLSSRVMYFERDDGGEFRPAREYARDAFTTANTHDMPTLEGFWKGSDVRLRRAVGLIDSDDAMEAALADREQERDALLRRLRAERVLGGSEVPEGTALRTAVHRFLDRTPSVAVGLSLDDIAGETEPVNVPGVGQDQYPSWTRRMSRSVEELRHDADARRLARCASRLDGRGEGDDG